MIRYEAPVGLRLNRYFIWVTVWSNEGEDCLWWSSNDRKWMIYEDIKGPASTCRGCHSLKSFKRMLRKHPNIQGRAELVSRYKGYSIYDDPE